MSDSTMIIGALPPPPGVVPNFVDPVNHMKNAIALHTIMLSAVTLCISIRVYARYHIQKELGLDDCKSLYLQYYMSPLMICRLLSGILRE